MKFFLGGIAAPAHTAPFLVLLLGATVFVSGCGGSSSMSPTTGGTTPGTPTPAPPPPPGPGSNSCPPVTVVEAAGPTTGVARFPAPAPLPAPTPGTTPFGSVCVATPDNNSTVTSPAHIVAASQLKNPISHMRVYIDGNAEYFTFFNTVDALLWMNLGPHTLDIVGTDTQGNNVSTTLQLTVVPPQAPGVTQIQKIPNWEPCSAKFPPGHPRAGQVCAAGSGDAVSTMTEGITSPSLSGSSAHFTMGGPKAYTNELYTKFLGGGSNVTQFTYDLNFMVDNPAAPQALEFDVNQTFGNRRWVFGTECNFKGSGKWDVWDGVKGWQPTSVPCNPFPANQWIHLIWTFERVGEQVHYVSVQVDNQVFPLNLFFSNQPGWTMEDIDVAFQMDGNFQQQPYNVWLDNVTLNAK